MDPALRDAVHAAVDLCSIAEAVAAHPGQDLEETPNSAGCITHADHAPLEAPETVRALRHASAERALTRARDRMHERLAALAKGETVPKPKPAAPLWSDPLTAVITGIRAALAVIVVAAFWFLTAWPSGPIAVICAGVVCTLLAPTPQPIKITAAAAATIVFFAVPLFVTQIVLLPYALDFFSMAVLLAPYFLICALIIAQPGVGPLGLLAAVYLAVSSHIDNNAAESYDPTAFFNTSLAIVLGIAVGAVLFAMFFPRRRNGRLAGFFARFEFTSSRFRRRPPPSLLSIQFRSFRTTRLDAREARR